MARMVSHEDVVYASFPGNQVVYLLKVNVTMGRIIVATAIPAVFDRQVCMGRGLETRAVAWG